MENNETEKLISFLRRLQEWNIIGQGSVYNHFRGVVTNFCDKFTDRYDRASFNPQSVFESFVNGIGIPDLNNRFPQPNVLGAAVFSPNFDRIFMERRIARGKWFLPEENVVPGRGYIETMIARLQTMGLDYVTYDHLRARFQFATFFQESNETYQRRIFFVPGVEEGGLLEHN